MRIDAGHRSYSRAPHITPYMQALLHVLPERICYNPALLGQIAPGEKIVLAQSPALDEHAPSQHDLVLIAVEISRTNGLPKSTEYIKAFILESPFEHRSGFELHQNGIVPFTFRPFLHSRFATGGAELIELSESQKAQWLDARIAFDPQIFQLCPA